MEKLYTLIRIILYILKNFFYNGDNAKNKIKIYLTKIFKALILCENLVKYDF